MTKEEIQKIFDKVENIVDNYSDYYTSYSVSSYQEWNKDETNISFTVYGHCSRGYGLDWEESWGIDSEGKIYAYDKVYNSLDEFKKEWY